MINAEGFGMIVIPASLRSDFIHIAGMPIHIPLESAIHIAGIRKIAKNCRTSVGMIEKYYGVHVKNSLNAAAINVVSSGKDEMAEEFEYLMDEEE